MLRRSLTRHSPQPLPPRRGTVPSHDARAASYVFENALVEQLTDYVRRGVTLQRKVMLKAGTDSPHSCNQVEVEVRLGQLQARRSLPQLAHADKDKNQRDDLQTGSVQNRRSLQLLHLPAQSPTLVEPAMSVFRTGFAVRSRCDNFFTVPVLTDEPGVYVEQSNRLIDPRLWELDTDRMITMSKRRAMRAGSQAGDADEDAAAGAQEPLNWREKFNEFVMASHRTHSSVLNETADATPDIAGSDALIQAPASWRRIGERPDGRIVSECNGGTQLQVHAFTSDGYRVEFEKTCICAIPDVGDEKKKNRKGTFNFDQRKSRNDQVEKLRRYTAALGPSDVPSSVFVTTDGTMMDRALNHRFEVNTAADGHTFTFMPQYLLADAPKVMTKSSLSTCNARMPFWAGDLRFSAAIERSAHDDGTPLPEPSTLFPIVKADWDKSKRLPTILRFRKRERYQLLRVDSGQEGIAWTDLVRAELEAALVAAGIVAPEALAAQSVAVREQPLPGGGVMRLVDDPIANAFVLPTISDSITHDLVASNGTTTYLGMELVSRLPRKGALLIHPEFSDFRQREVEVEVDMPRLTEAAIAFEKHFPSNCARLTALLHRFVSTRVLDAAGAIALLP